MPEYQLQIQQLVSYPRCRIYREFLQTLIADRGIRTSGRPGLFCFSVLCSYANFRTSYLRVDGINYTIYPGEWICRVGELTQALRLRSHRQTSYEDVYGSKYNYGGRNVVDYDVPELEYGLQSTTMTGVMERTILPGLQQVVASTDGSGYGIGGTSDGTGIYGVGGSNGPITELVEATGTGAGSGSTPTVIPETPQITVPDSPAYTSVQGMAYQDGSIGTLKISKLGISVKVWEGESDASMAKGVAHYSSTSAWAGNVGLCGHNRGAKYNIGTIKNLVAGDTITYTTMYGTRTYQVTEVKIISNNDWSYLQSTADNRITITTCLENHPESRVLVQAVEVK